MLHTGRVASKVLFAPLFFFTLLACGLYAPCGALAQSQPQNFLTDKNVLILHALEANMPLNLRTDRAIREALEAGGLA